MVMDTETKTVNLHANMWEYNPKVLWQQLFNLYRKLGGDLENLSNLLVDYRNCQTMVFDRIAMDKSAVRFLWGMTPKLFMTTWIDESGWWNNDLRLTAGQTSAEIVYLFEVNENDITFREVLSPDEY